MMPFHVEKAEKLVVEWLKPGFYIFNYLYIHWYFFSRTTGKTNNSATNIKKSVSQNSVSNTPVRVKSTIAGRVSPQVNHRKQEMEQEYQKMLSEMTQQTMELKVTIEQVEKEREFYFSKLREIEMFVQSNIDNPSALDTESVLKEIQAVMYKTEEGFEVPDAVILSITYKGRFNFNFLKALEEEEIF